MKEYTFYVKESSSTYVTIEANSEEAARDKITKYPWKEYEIRLFAVDGNSVESNENESKDKEENK